MTNFIVSKRSNCRLCGSSHIDQILNFEAVPFFDEVVTEENIGHEFSYPMKLFFCLDCLSVQSQHDVNLIEYYHTYQYIASNSAFVRNYMQALVDYCKSNLGLRLGDKIIEIGAADGYLLSLFKEKGADILGFEAADNLCDLASNKGVPIVNALFTEESLNLIPKSFKETQFILLLHTFDHLYDPSPFLEAVQKVLDQKRGILLLEVHDLNDIYDKGETALFGHEHATYLHYGSMKRFLNSHDLRIIDFNFLPKKMCRGSSMLIAATPERSDIKEKSDLKRFENPKLDELSTFKNFQETVSISYQKLRSYIESHQKNGRRFAGYGGWGRGVTTLAMAQLTNQHLEFIIDGNSSLQGCYTPVSKIKIVNPNIISREIVDEIIVFNYAYIDEIKQNLSDFISKGGIIISVIDLMK